MRAETRFPAMGSDVHVVVVGGTVGSLDLARDLVAELEARWSRFLDDSEVTRMNREAGRPVTVTGATIALVERALEGARVTGGRFDPTVLRAVERAGYDRTFDGIEHVGHAEHHAPPLTAEPLPLAGYDRVLVDRTASTVTVPRGVGFDPGGIGKGFAADLVVEALLRDGAAGACVNVGGDLRVEGESPSGGPWIAGVEHPTRSRLAALLFLDRGAVATSARTRRTWGPGRHHLIDPSTGAPAATPLVAATAVAAEGWQAEVLSKTAFLAGPADGLALLEAQGAQGLVVDEDGTVTRSAGLDAFTRPALAGAGA